LYAETLIIHYDILVSAVEAGDAAEFSRTFFLGQNLSKFGQNLDNIWQNLSNLGKIWTDLREIWAKVIMILAKL